MGLSSSQARLLNLTSRMHQIEYKAAKVEAMKLQMANESSRVYEEYLDALDKTKVQIKTLNTDGSVTYKDIKSYAEDFLKAGYAINYKGIVYDGKSYKVDKANNVFAASAEVVTVTAANKDTYPGFNVNDKIALTPDGSYAKVTGTLSAEAALYDFAKLCADAFGAETAPTGKDVETVITNLINSGDVTIVRKDKAAGAFPQESHEFFADFETSVATDTGLQEVTDEVNLKKAEAKYEADMKKIDAKDRKYDTDLAALDAERNAIKQEMDTLKSVAKDNVERTFKLFS